MLKKLFLAGTALLLSGCNQVQEHRFKSAAHASFEDALFDAPAARFRNERVVSGDKSGSVVLCGEVNAKNRVGAYVGWQRFVVEGLVDGMNKPLVLTPLIEDAEGPLNAMFQQRQRRFCDKADQR